MEMSVTYVRKTKTNNIEIPYNLLQNSTSLFYFANDFKLPLPIPLPLLLYSQITAKNIVCIKVQSL